MPDSAKNSVNLRSLLSPLHPANLGWLGLSALVIGLDQWSKWFAVQHLAYAEPVPVLPVLNWTLLHNTGAAFSFLANAGGWQQWFFMALAFFMSLALIVWLLRTPSQNKVLLAALALILGGAIGNLIDRASLGYVVDFIHAHYQDHHFPAFNLADAAITLGAGLLLLDSFVMEPKRQRQLSE